MEAVVDHTADKTMSSIFKYLLQTWHCQQDYNAIDVQTFYGQEVSMEFHSNLDIVLEFSSLISPFFKPLQKELSDS